MCCDGIHIWNVDIHQVANDYYWFEGKHDMKLSRCRLYHEVKRGRWIFRYISTRRCIWYLYMYTSYGATDRTECYNHGTSLISHPKLCIFSRMCTEWHDLILCAAYGHRQPKFTNTDYTGSLFVITFVVCLHNNCAVITLVAESFVIESVQI